MWRCSGQIITNQIGNFDITVKAGQGVVAGLTNYFSPANPAGFQGTLERGFELPAAGNFAEAVGVLGYGLNTTPLLFSIGW